MNLNLSSSYTIDPILQLIVDQDNNTYTYNEMHENFEFMLNEFREGTHYMIHSLYDISYTRKRAIQYNRIKNKLLKLYNKFIQIWSKIIQASNIVGDNHNHEAYNELADNIWFSYQIYGYQVNRAEEYLNLRSQS